MFNIFLFGKRLRGRALLNSLGAVLVLSAAVFVTNNFATKESLDSNTERFRPAGDVREGPSPSISTSISSGDQSHAAGPAPGGIRGAHGSGSEEVDPNVVVSRFPRSEMAGRLSVRQIMALELAKAQNE